MFSNIKQRTIALYHFFQTRKKHLASFVVLSFLFLAVSIFVGTHLAMAAGDQPSNSGVDTSGFTGAIVSAIVNMLLAGAAIMLKFALFALSFIIEVAGYNGYLSSTAVNIGWVMVRDITNMFFVVVLLLVAFGTILGLEQYEWKKMLVKFFFAAVLVNFSRTICGVIIDIGQVIMITFVNGIAATAGGNLINAFGLTDIFSLSNTASPDQLTSKTELFGAAVGAIVFSALTLGMMLVFVFMLVSRLIVLWILIVLSPFAFVLSVIPQTQKYASQWWSEFGNHVVVGPAVVFFLWLAFAVVGGGNINNEIANNSQVPDANKTTTDQSAGIGKAMNWNSMSNFAIAIGILLVGAKTAQSLGPVGGSARSKATDFGKKVAMVASGATAAMWAGRKAKEGAVGAAKLAGKGLYTATLDNTVQQVKMWGQRQLEGYRSWRAGGPKPKTDEEGNIMKDENGNIIFEKEEQRGLVGRYLAGRQASLLRSEKMLDKVKNQRTVREDLIKARAGAVPTYLMQKMEGPGIRDLDRMEQGQLEAEKERSAAKTAEFKTIGRAAVLANDRFKAGRWETAEEMGDKYKGTVGEQVVSHKERAATADAQIKALFAAAKSTSNKVKQATKAKIQAELKAEVEEKQATLTQGGMKLAFLGGGAGAALLARQSRIGAEEKEEHAKVEALEKGAAAAFAKTHDAQDMLDAQKEAELRSKVFAGDIAEAESDADMRVRNSATGKGLVHDLNISEQAKNAAESFIKRLKDEDLKMQFEEAGKALSEAAKQGPEALERLAQENLYVRAMQQAKKSGHEGEVLGIVQKESESLAEAEYVDKGLRGFGTPSSALVAVAKKSGDDLNSLNNAALGKALTDNLFFLAGDAATTSSGNADISKRAALFGTISKVNTECYIDDAMGVMAAELSRLYSDKELAKMSPEEKARLQKMKNTFVDQTGLFSEETGADGKKYIKGTSNARTSAIMQNYAITGGNIDLMNKHAKIEEAMKADKSLSYGDAMEKALGADGAKDFAEEMRKYDTFLREATTSFKNNALAGGHLQLGGHQMFDEKLGFHRMSTAEEAAAIMEAEVRKRGSKAGYQFHSLGDLDTGRNVMERVDARAFGNTIGKVTSHLEAKNIQDRTIDAMMGYVPSEGKEMDGEHGILGGSEEKIKERFGSVENFLKQVVVPQLAAGPQAFSLMAQRKFGNVDKIAAENGSLKLQIGDKIIANSLSDLIGQVQTMLGNQIGDMAGALEASKKQAEALQKNIKKAVESAKKEGGSEDSEA